MCKIECKDCECCLEYANAKVYLIEYKCLCCNNNYQENFDENLNEQFANTYKFPNDDIKKFILFFRKGAYP